jgi:hypothetical protein
VAPARGWSYLRVDHGQVDQPTFVNESAQTIAVFAARPEQMPVISGQQVQYKHVKITWLDLAQEVGGDRLLEGWIEQETPLARLRVLTGGPAAPADPAIVVLCDAIRVDSP